MFWSGLSGRRIGVGGAIVAALALVCAGPAAAQNSNKTRKDYVGDETCRGCHAEKAASYEKTAHHLTSRWPGKEAILGSFAQGENIFKTANPGLYFRMDDKTDGFYETAVRAFPPVTDLRSEKMDLVIGSGRVGQTYLFWEGDKLFQLPVSYWVDLKSWGNSPGYRDGMINFERLVAPRCLECHVTFAVGIGNPQTSNRFEKTSIVPGLSCERCHGPGREHAEAEQAKLAAGRIVNPEKLSRDRQMDVCAQCHGGRRFLLGGAFSYVPGEPLDRFYRPDPANAGIQPDVHGNQVALLQMSRCYQASAEMNCSTCHDVHQPQRDIVALSERCMKCHGMEACGESAKRKEKILGRCVECHMPIQASNLVISNTNGKQTRAMVRSHWIKVYEESAMP